MPEQKVVTEATDQRVSIVVRANKDRGFMIAVEVIVTAAAIDRVISVAAMDRIAAGVPKKLVIALAAGDDVVAFTTVDLGFKAGVKSGKVDHVTAGSAIRDNFCHTDKGAYSGYAF